MSHTRYGSLVEVARLLNVSRDTAYRWVNSGYLPCIRLGRNTGKGGRRRPTLRFDMDEVKRWLEDFLCPAIFPQFTLSPLNDTTRNQSDETNDVLHVEACC